MFAGRGRCQESVCRDARSAPLTVTSSGKKSSAPLDGHATSRASGCPWCRWRRSGGLPPRTGCEGGRLASAAATVSAPAREGTAQPTPRPWTEPRPFPAMPAPWWSSTPALPLDPSHGKPCWPLLALARGLAAASGRMACRRHALDAVEKVVTGLSDHISGTFGRCLSGSA